MQNENKMHERNAGVTSCLYDGISLTLKSSHNLAIGIE